MDQAFYDGSAKFIFLSFFLQEKIYTVDRISVGVKQTHP
jgi:hypothetical protein